jgi:hypothetical protein
MGDTTAIDKTAYRLAKDAVDTIEAQIDAIEKPFRDAMRAAVAPFDNALEAALDRLEEVMDGQEILGKCDICGEAVFDGERRGSLGEAGITCATHAPFMSEIVQSWEDAVATDPDAWAYDSPFDSRAEMESWIMARRAEIAERGDWQVTYG